MRRLLKIIENQARLIAVIDIEKRASFILGLSVSFISSDKAPLGAVRRIKQLINLIVMKAWYKRQL